MPPEKIKELVLESANQNESIEWWFVQGRFEGKEAGKYSFMISFFRNNFADASEKPINGFSLLFSLLSYDKMESKFISKIDRTVLDDVSNILDKKGTDLDPELMTVLNKELTTHGIPRPIQLGNANAELTGSSFHIWWEDFKLTQIKDGFIIDFPDLFNGGQCQIILKPYTPRFELLDSNKNKLMGGKTTYFCYPKLSIDGDFHGMKISGSAWMDHQWGERSSGYIDEPVKKILGWDWFGINLDDGRAIVILIHKYARTNERIFTLAILIDNENNISTTETFEARTLEHWESQTSHIIYPVKWEIKIKALNLEMTFHPDILNQEIPVFGSVRAIWQGSGYIEGFMNGEKISGKARGEFFGYGYIFDFQNYLQRLADRVDKRIEEFFPKKMDAEQIQKYVGKPYWEHEPIAYTRMLSEPLWDLILRRGKRWRPMFGILMGEALGKSPEHYEASACLAELVHSGALIVDDIEDNSLLRRGEQTLHLKYGVDVALNAGNTMYFLPHVESLTHKYLNDIQKLRIHQIWMKTLLEAHFGQTLDIYWSRNMTQENLSLWMNDSLEPKILQMYDYKTAASAKGLAEVAAVVAEVDDEVKQTVVSFARAFAVAFQIIDDTHNFSSSPEWTKTCGEDLSNGKLTYVIIKAIKMLDQSGSDRLKEILCNKKLREERTVLEEGIGLIRSSGALEASRKFAHELSMAEWEKFARVVPSCEPKIMLNMLCLKMLDLAFEV